MKRILARPGHSPLLLWKMILALASFRAPMPVAELKVFPDCCDRPDCYICPRCGITTEREFMSFCNCCGQRLDWRNCQNAEMLYPQPNSESVL